MKSPKTNEDKMVVGITRKQFLKTAGVGSAAVAALPALLESLATPASAAESAALVRWDIISINPLPPANGSTISAGGEAFAFAYHTPGNPSAAWIRLTGAGTFVAPGIGGESSAVTGGGTWQTSGPGLPEASGTYRVTKLVSWQFATFQIHVPAFIDEIADVNTEATGNAVLLIEYDDGSTGILGIGCHGPGAPNGLLEGVIASKGYVTYWNGVLPPGPLVDQNRTIFHVLR